MWAVWAVAVCACAGASAQQSPAPEGAEPPSIPSAEAGPLRTADTELIAAAMSVYFRAEDEPLADTPSDESPVLLSVEDAVEMALERNPQVHVAASEAGAAQAQIGQARSQILPQVQGQASATYIDDTDIDIGGGPLGGRLAQRFVGVDGGSDTMTTGQVTVNQVLFAGGQIRAAIRASQYLAESQEWRRLATLADLELQTRQAYYGVLLARALERVAQESVTTFERHLHDAERMYDVGLISGFEVLRARTELGTRQSDAVSAENAVRLAKANLRRQLALPPDTPIRLEGEPDLEPVALPVERLVARAQERRPELRALEAGIRAAEQELRRNRGQYWPRIAAQGQYVESDGGIGAFAGAQEGFSASVGAQVDIFAGGRRKWEVAEARERLNSVVHQHRDVMELVELDVTRAYINVQDAAARVLAERGNVELAREGLRLAELRFQEGVGTQTEVLDALLALTGAESALAEALHGYAVAHAELDRAVGGDLESPSVQ